MNLKSKINKLQRGLQSYGLILLINRHQVYLRDKDAICTKYIVKTPTKVLDDKYGEYKNKQIVIFDGFSQVELVKFLAEKLKEVQNGIV